MLWSKGLVFDSVGFTLFTLLESWVGSQEFERALPLGGGLTHAIFDSNSVGFLASKSINY